MGAHLRTCFVFPLLFAGLAPVFVDCLTPALVLDGAAVADAAAPDIRAAFLSAPWGIAQDVAPIRDALARRDCRLVLDATDCLSPLFARTGMAAGADVTIVSLGEGHSPLSTGEGGAILSDDAALIARASAYQRFSDLEGLLPGINQKISSVQAALGLHRLRRLACEHATARAAADELRAELVTVGVQEGPPSTLGTYLTVRLPEPLADPCAAVARLPRAHRLPAAAAHARHCPRLDATADALCAIPVGARRQRHA